MLNTLPPKTTKALNRRLLERLRLLPAEVFDSGGFCFFDHLTILNTEDTYYNCYYEDAARELDFTIMAYPNHGLVFRSYNGNAMGVLDLAECYGLVEQYLPKRKDCRVCHN